MFLPQVRDQVPHPYRTTGKVTVLYILISSFFFFIWDRKTKDFWLNNSTEALLLITDIIHKDTNFMRQQTASRT
jgi:hypothetical protein